MPPLLYLIRHAHALDNPDDNLRLLSERGHHEVELLARVLRPSGAFQPQEVWHSTLVRARETAELLLKGLRLNPPRLERRDLEPEANPQLVAHSLAAVPVPLALFGHEPHMSSLASLLVGGDPEAVLFGFQKATMLALEPAGARWCVRWQISPDLFAE